VPQLLHDIVHLLDLSVGEVKLLARFLDLSENVGLWLVGTLNHFLVQFGICLKIVHL
jgi:hypothetical protein